MVVRPSSSHLTNCNGKSRSRPGAETQGRLSSFSGSCNIFYKGDTLKLTSVQTRKNLTTSKGGEQMTRAAPVAVATKTVKEVTFYLTAKDGAIIHISSLFGANATSLRSKKRAASVWCSGGRFITPQSGASQCNSEVSGRNFSRQL